MTGVEDGWSEGGVGAEGHAVVVELCAGVEFMDAGHESRFPDLEGDFGGKEGEVGEVWGGAFEGADEGIAGFEEGGVWGELGADLERERGGLFGGRFVDDVGEVGLFDFRRAAGLFFFGHLEGFDGACRTVERIS